MARPHAAAVIEDAWHRRVNAVLRRRGWRTRIVSHTGYGSESFVRVLGRVLLTRRPEVEASADAEATPRELEAAEDEQRGWRAFITAPAMDVPVTVSVGGRQVQTCSDRSGYIDVTIPHHGLPSGWHDVRLSSPDSQDVDAAVRIVSSGEGFGIISDIDDTVISTSLPRPLIAAWNTFVRHEAARHVVPGMATMYQALLDEHPEAPIVYVSTGAWNTAPTLTRFLKRHGYPLGPLLLTDWGPTNTGWFRSGQEHKRSCLHRLARELPNVRWVLVGDDGQHDPRIYGDFAEERPDRVEAVAIRQLTPTEQVLSHGIPVPNEELAPRSRQRSEVPVCRAPDGYGLLRLLHTALGTSAAG
jgi:phosphatidate phosphatase APP1